MQDFQESVFIIAETRVCITRMRAVTRANGEHASQGRQAIRESALARLDAERVMRPGVVNDRLVR